MTRVTRRTFVGSAAAVAGAGLLAPLTDRLATPVHAAPGLPKRPFGKTGVDVTIVGLGGGSRFYEPVPDDELGAEMVRRAIDSGIGFMETGANYGPNGESERRIGLAMKTHRAKVFLETKVDDRTYDGAMKEMERSLSRLQTDKLDLVLHHNLGRTKDVDTIASADGAEKAVRKMIDQKVVRFRGVSCHSPALMLDAIKRLDPQAIQLIANATRVPDVEREVLPLARERGIAVIVMKSVGKGYFLPKNFTKPDRIDQFGPPAGVFEANKNLPTAKEYFAYTLSLPISTIVVGIDSIPTLEAVLRDVADIKPLTMAEMKSISDRAQVFRTTGFWLPQTLG